LSGGGTRGAYEVGVLLGMLESLGSSFQTISPFDAVAGTSVGAINAAFVAANAHHPGLDIDSLVKAWVGMDFSTVFSPQLLQFVRQLARGTSAPKAGTRRLGASLLNPIPLEELVRDTVSFDAIHANIKNSAIHALFIAALTSAISLLEVVVSSAIDGLGWSRQRATWWMGGLITLMGIPAAWSLDVLGVMDQVANNFFLLGGGLALSIFVGWVMKDPVGEVSIGTSGIRWFFLWRTLLRFVVPAVLLYVLFDAIPGTVAAIGALF